LLEQSRGSGTLQPFQVTFSAPKRASLAVFSEEITEHPLFGPTVRKRLFCLANLYDRRISQTVDIADIGNTFDVKIEKVPHPLEFVLMDGKRPDPRFAFQRLRALWLLVENRSNQLNNDPVLPFRHQAALLQFLTSAEAPLRVLVADEVGLGKTVEAGLLIRHVLKENPNTRVLYATLGGLVANVLEEFQRLDLPRWHYYANLGDTPWTSLNALPTAALVEETPRVVASTHKLFDTARWQEQHTTLADTRFDLIVIDECHTLRAYGPGAESQQVWFRSVRQLLQDHLTANGRVLFLSATPHQGNREVFLNLVALCVGTPVTDSQEEKARAARGRVIFRVKEQIRDWDNSRVFPARDVREPQLAEPPLNYQAVLEAIGAHFDWIADNADGAQAKAVGFVKSQALQYAASSLRAGFAYLLRRLFRYNPEQAASALADKWASRLLPYRKNIVTSSDLLKEWLREFKAQLPQPEAEEEDGELNDGPEPRAASAELSRLITLLEMYDALFDDAEASAKFTLLSKLVGQLGEPIVVFSQAVDTVYELEARLKLGGYEVYRLTGDMPTEDRSAVVRAFRTSSNPCRLLLSSAAGGIGINLQVARVAIHFDLPWNPMVLEQRVGRVHRIGSIKTILVETILLRGSREAQVFERITHRLQDIVKDLSNDPTEREALFRRILASLDPESLRELFSGEQDLDAVGAAVDAGRTAVDDADTYMRELAARTTERRGRASTQQLLDFLRIADSTFRSVGANTYAVVTEGESGNLTQRECEAELYSFDGDGDSLVFDRIGASYLGLSREQTGGIGHPRVDPLIRAALDLTDEPKSRCSTWISLRNSSIDEIQSGDIVYLALETPNVDLNLAASNFRGWRIRGEDWSELQDSTIAALLWHTEFGASQKAGGAPSLESMLEQVTSQIGPTSLHFPIAAIGIRE
jgi:superfamily II DNA or RNA helicase